jgi:hypothetical protein
MGQEGRGRLAAKDCPALTDWAVEAERSFAAAQDDIPRGWRLLTWQRLEPTVMDYSRLIAGRVAVAMTMAVGIVTCSPS